MPTGVYFNLRNCDADHNLSDRSMYRSNPEYTLDIFFHDNVSAASGGRGYTLRSRHRGDAFYSPRHEPTGGISMWRLVSGLGR